MTFITTRAKFRKRLDSLEPTLENLEHVAKALGDKKDSDPEIIEMTDRFLLISTDNPNDQGADKRIDIFVNAGNTFVSKNVFKKIENLRNINTREELSLNSKLLETIEYQKKIQHYIGSDH